MAVPAHRHRFAAAAVIVTIAIAALQLFSALWNRSALEDLARQPGGWWGGIAIAVGTAIVHEALHAFVFIALAGVPWRAIALRPTWRVMGFAAHSTVPISPHVTRISAITPAIVLGLVPLAIGLASGNGLWVFWGVFCSLECFSDWIVLFSSRAAQTQASDVGL